MASAPADGEEKGAIANKGRGARPSLQSIPLLSQARLETLLETQREAAIAKKKLTTELRAARRKRNRVVKKLQHLSNDDLAAVIDHRLQGDCGFGADAKRPRLMADEAEQPEPAAEPSTPKADDGQASD
jgi:hypothetical protein